MTADHPTNGQQAATPAFLSLFMDAMSGRNTRPDISPNRIAEAERPTRDTDKDYL